MKLTDKSVNTSKEQIIEKCIDGILDNFEGEWETLDSGGWSVSSRGRLPSVFHLSGFVFLVTNTALPCHPTTMSLEQTEF